MRKHNFITDKYQKFGFRKYLGIGLCSVVLGSFFVVSGQSQQVKADTVDGSAQTSTVVTTSDSTGDADELSQVVEKNAPPASTVQENAATENSDTGQTQNNTVETTDEKTVATQEAPAAPTQQVPTNEDAVKTESTNNTPENATQQSSTQNVTETAQNTDTQKTQASDGISKSAEAETTPSPAKEDTVTLDVKNIKNTDTKGLTESKVQVATTDNGGYDEATWGKLDITKWTIDENYELTGYNGDLTHIIIPNEADFTKAGQTVGQVGISSTLTHSWFTGKDRPVSIAISKTEGKTVKALGNDWSFGFSGNSWPKHDYYHINPSSLAHFDGNNLDVSGVTKFDHIFADNKLSDTSGVSDWKFGNNAIYARGMFRSNPITDLNGLKDWDTSHFTNLDYMFDKNSFSDLTPLQDWNVSHVTTMIDTFSNNPNLTTLHGLERWTTDDLTNLDETFSGSALNDISALSSWDVSHVKTMAGTFLNNSIKDLSPLVNWEVGNVTRFTSTFMSNKIEDLSPLANWDTHSSTSMTQMFFNNNIKSLKPLSKWTTNNVTYMIQVFDGNKLTDLDGIETWNTSNVTTMRGMFENNQLIDVTALKNWDTSKVQDISSMLLNNSLDTADLTNWNLDNVKAAGNFINAPGKLVVVVKSKYVNLMKGKSETYLYSPYLDDVVKATDSNAVTVGKNYKSETPTIYGANDNETARQAIKAVVDAIVNQYKKDNPDKIVIPDKDLDSLTLIQLANAHFNIGYNNYYQFIDDNHDDKSPDISQPHNFQGQVDETVNLNIKIPENYELAPDQVEPPTSYTFIDGTNQPIIIHLVHKTLDVSDDKNVDAHRTVERNIFETSPLDGTVTKTHQEVKFNRSAIQDLVTKEIKYGNWSSYSGMLGNSTYKATVYDGYYPSQSTVPPIEVNPDSKPVDVYITYTANGQKTYYRYVDDDLKDDQGQPLQVGIDHEIDGKTNETIPLSIGIPENYLLAKGQIIPTSYTFKAKPEDNLPIIIHLVHGTRDATNDKNVDVHRTIGRTITEHNPFDDKVKTTRQEVTFNRTATQDLVTGKITYGAWDKDVQHLPEYDAARYPGYTANDPQVPDIEVRPSDIPADFDITFTPDDQMTYYKFVDDMDNQKTVGEVHKLTGKTDQTIHFTVTAIPENYDLAKGQTLPTEYKFLPYNNQEILIHLVHQKRDVTYEEGIDHHRTVGRVITETSPIDGTVKTINQSTEFNRTATLDLVTNHISYSEWTPDIYTFDDYTATEYIGYTPNIPYVDYLDVDVISKPEDVHITYTADTQTNYYKFVDDNNDGKQVGENHNFDGKTDQTVDLDIKVPENYKLADGQTVPTSYKFKAENNLPIIIHLVHDTRDATNDKDVDVHRTVGRTINETNPHTEEVKKIYQSVEFTRTATQDLVTKEITYGKWTPKNGVLDSYDATKYEGYTANIPHVNELEVNADSKPDDIDIFYTADGQTNFYKFVDDTEGGKQVGDIYNFEGNTGQKVDLAIKIPENYKLAKDQTVPTDYTFKAKDNLPIIIHLVHQTQPVKEEKTITRTITTIKPDGTTSKQVQKVSFTRNGVKDLVTNTTKYDDWDAKTKTFPSQDVQQIDGYDSYVDDVEAKVVNSQDVTPSDKDIQVTVTYKAHDGGNNTPDTPPEPETPPEKKDDPTDDKHPTPPDEKPDPEPDDDIPKEPSKKEKTKKNKNTNKPKPTKDSGQNGPVKAEHVTPQNIGNAPVKGTSLVSNHATTNHMTETDVKSATSATNKKHATLPETGETNHLAIAALGLALAGLSLFGFKKKKRT